MSFLDYSRLIFVHKKSSLGVLTMHIDTDRYARSRSFGRTEYQFFYNGGSIIEQVDSQAHVFY